MRMKAHTKLKSKLRIARSLVSNENIYRISFYWENARRRFLCCCCCCVQFLIQFRIILGYRGDDVRVTTVPSALAYWINRVSLDGHDWVNFKFEKKKNSHIDRTIYQYTRARNVLVVFVWVNTEYVKCGTFTFKSFAHIHFCGRGPQQRWW